MKKELFPIVIWRILLFVSAASGLGTKNSEKNAGKKYFLLRVGVQRLHDACTPNHRIFSSTETLLAPLATWVIFSGHPTRLEDFLAWVYSFVVIASLGKESR